MNKTWNRALIAAIGMGLASVLLASSAFAAEGGSRRLASEVDNGVSWTLATRSSHLSSAVQSPSYADAGVVADIGAASRFNGIFVTGSGPLADNIWIGDGSEAYTSGTHLLSDVVNFSYGFDNHDGTFYMTSGPKAGLTLTIAQIQTAFAGFEAYASVGVVYGGTPVKGTSTRSTGTAPITAT